MDRCGSRRMTMEQRRVVFYGRVSTQSEEQLSAFSNQMTWYGQLLGQHPEWTVVGQYEDPGVTGTSIRKRKGFQQMLEDGIRRHRYDLIVTRETKRFARNTVDALSYVRLLKEHGIEVFFVNDAIHTISDQDGELRLSIMATIAQEESRKISENVKAGQRISRQKGILRGNGNILGYRRTGRNRYEIDPEQAAAVRNIYQWYLEGKSIRTIKQMLEAYGFRTATGKTVWQQEVIAQVLRNPFYTGRQLQLQRISDGYLTQKRKRNSPESMESIKGAYEPIISTEEFEEVQRLKYARRSREGGRGKKESGSVWWGRYVCSCGCRMVRRTGRGDGYFFVCPSSIRRKRSVSVWGTPEEISEKKGVCAGKATAEWKLDMIAFYVLRNIWRNRDADLEQAWRAIDACWKEEECADCCGEEAFQAEIQKLEKRKQVLLDMRADGEISKEEYAEKRKEYDTRIGVLRRNMTVKEQEREEAGDTGKKLKQVRESLETLTDLTGPKLNKELIAACIRRVIRTSEQEYHVYLSSLNFDREGFEFSGLGTGNAALGGIESAGLDMGKADQGDLRSAALKKGRTTHCRLLKTKVLTYEDAASYRGMSGRRVMKNRWSDLVVHIYLSGQ